MTRNSLILHNLDEPKFFGSIAHSSITSGILPQVQPQMLSPTRAATALEVSPAPVEASNSQVSKLCLARRPRVKRSLRVPVKHPSPEPTRQPHEPDKALRAQEGQERNSTAIGASSFRCTVAWVRLLDAATSCLLLRCQKPFCFSSVFYCASRNWRHGKITLITTLPVLDCFALWAQPLPRISLDRKASSSRKTLN